MQIRSFRVSEVISEIDRVRVRVHCWLNDHELQLVVVGTTRHPEFETYTYDFRGPASRRFTLLRGFAFGEKRVKSWEKEHGQFLDSSALRDFILNVGEKLTG